MKVGRVYRIVEQQKSDVVLSASFGTEVFDSEARRPPNTQFYFDPTTWVVWANSQFATVLVYFFFLSFFLFIYFIFLFSSAGL